MSQFPCLIRSSSPGGEVRYVLGDPLVDSYLAFVAGRCRSAMDEAFGVRGVSGVQDAGALGADLVGGAVVDAGGGVEPDAGVGRERRQPLLTHWSAETVGLPQCCNVVRTGNKADARPPGQHGTDQTWRAALHELSRTTDLVGPVTSDVRPGLGLTQRDPGDVGRPAPSAKGAQGEMEECSPAHRRREPSRLSIPARGGSCMWVASDGRWHERACSCSRWA